MKMRLNPSQQLLALRFADVLALRLPAHGYLERDYWVSRRDRSVICRVDDCELFGLMLDMGYEDIVGGGIGFDIDLGKWVVFDDSGVCWFGVGSECGLGDVGYIPSDMSEHLELIRLAGARWFRDSLEVKYIEEEESVLLKWVYSMDSPLAGRIGHEFVRIRRGRGCWVASDMNDALEMAKDYAHNLGRLFEYGVYIKPME